MTDPLVFVLAGLIANTIFSFIVGYVASQKGRSAFGLFFLSFFTSFLIGILVVIALPRLAKPVLNQQTVLTGPAKALVFGDSHPEAWIKQEDGRHRWWNGECWTDYFTNYPHHQETVDRVKAAFADNPPRWIEQEGGRMRWWAGEGFSDDWKNDDTEEVVTLQAPNASVADEIKKLAELHQSGVLTDEQFAAAKKSVIGT